MAYADGDILQTLSGRRVHLLDPKPQDVSVDDIAHALSRCCRFGGHVQNHYSVAQHSVLVSRLVQPENAIIGLLHDATEAYIGDMVSPLKHNMPEFEQVEGLWAKAIGLALLGDGNILGKSMPKEVHEADDKAFHAEWASMFPSRPQLPGAPPRAELPLVMPMEAPLARAMFLSRWAELRHLAK